MGSGNALSALGLNETEEDAYRALLQLRAADVETLAGRLDVPTVVAAKLLAALLERGLVKMVGDGVYAGCAPDLAVVNLLAGRLDQLRRGYDALADLERIYRGAQARHGALDGTENVTGATAILSRINQLYDSARAEIRMFIRPPLMEEDEPGGGDGPAPRKVRRRSLYEKSLLDDPAAMTMIRNCASEGVQVRFAATLPLKLMIIDQSVVVIMDPVDMESALISEHPTILTLATGMFEMMWPTAIPAPLGTEFDRALPSEPGLSDPDDRLLLSLLLSGLTDQAIAARLGIGLRTVQRRVRDLMDAAEVDTRIQLGWQASRRGWVD
ncbi:helix-turn-helix domain-containing protein [Stackebrandtia soli]|uniref:helix-turn-helix domain-containing protein n=1 Tax=Stackebrandtia soli TaxID=1892856 RepID=UPI0039EC37F7